MTRVPASAPGQARSTSGFTLSRRSAQQGFTPSLRSAQQGFTLVEMMVVLAIVGLAAAAVVLTIAPGGADARAEAERLAVRTAALRDRAIVEGRAMAVTISPSGFAFERRAAGQWAVLADGRLKRRDWPDGVRIDGATRVVFNRVGLPDHPAIVRVDTGDSAAVVRIDAAGDVTVE